MKTSLLILLLFPIVSMCFVGCQKSTYIVMRSDYGADTIKIGVGLVVTKNETSAPEIALDTFYLRKYIKKYRP
jgi:hypothetical protein